ncbi:MAG: protein-glutamate O-methyltransferase CheR [Lachnospiraceae bacterium]|nr:protein-glutamate O-methyltransferase CheR [Lachnospiraceae bacterium]
MENYEQFQKDILKLTAIDLTCYKERQMRRRIETLANKNGMKNFQDYFKLLKTDKEKFDEFINFMTINVSEFYRNPDQWKFMDEQVFPKLFEKFGKNLKIWSAACSTGDEPYSLVMALSRHMPVNQVKILATDIDNTVISKAKVGLYDDKSIAGVPADLKKKYFTKVGNANKIADEIKARVEFKKHNLLKDPYPTGCHLIVCRNVVIYFTEEAKDDIYRKFYNSLVNHGMLFIGSTEQIMNYKDIGYVRNQSFFFSKDEQ